MCFLSQSQCETSVRLYQVSVVFIKKTCLYHITHHRSETLSLAFWHFYHTKVNYSTSKFKIFFIQIQIFQAIAVRYLHTAYRNGLHIGNQIVSNAYLLRSFSDAEQGREVIRSKYKIYRKRKSLTSEWVANRSIRDKRYTTSSASDVNSSEELLKPIVE